MPPKKDFYENKMQMKHLFYNMSRNVIYTNTWYNVHGCCHGNSFKGFSDDRCKCKWHKNNALKISVSTTLFFHLGASFRKRGCKQRAERVWHTNLSMTA